jgi:Domain of unknown function (DUF4158)
LQIVRAREPEAFLEAEIFQCRGEAQRRRFAVQLCTLRIYGRFLPKAVSAPVAITNHPARQLDLSPVLFGEVPERLATETDHLQRIRAIDLRRVSLPMIRYFAEVTKRYDVRALRRFPPAKRYSLWPG